MKKLLLILMLGSLFMGCADQPTFEDSKNISEIELLHKANPDGTYGKEITNPEIAELEEDWFSYVNSFDKIEAFAPTLSASESENISSIIQEYYSRIKGDRKVPTKIIGDYGESLILAHEYLRTKETKRQNLPHLHNAIHAHTKISSNMF